MHKKGDKVTKVVCAIIVQEGNVLITQRSEHMTQPLLWEFPGGRIEPGETEEECLERETLEELNIAIKPKRRLTPVIYTYPAHTIELIPYICSFESGEVCLLEHAKYEWVQKEALANYAWCPADLPIVAEYRQLSC